MRPMKRSTVVMVAGCATVLLVPSLWLWGELRAMRRELDDWKQAQVELAASHPTPDEVLQRSGGDDPGSLVRADDGSVELVFVSGPQWHYACFKIEAGRAVAVTFSVK